MKITKTMDPKPVFQPYTLSIRIEDEATHKLLCYLAAPLAPPWRASMEDKFFKALKAALVSDETPKTVQPGRV